MHFLSLVVRDPEIYSEWLSAHAEHVGVVVHLDALLGFLDVLEGNISNLVRLESFPAVIFLFDSLQLGRDNFALQLVHLIDELLLSHVKGDVSDVDVGHSAGLEGLLKILSDWLGFLGRTVFLSGDELADEDELVADLLLTVQLFDGLHG